jgi:hypothetical protein
MLSLKKIFFNTIKNPFFSILFILGCSIIYLFVTTYQKENIQIGNYKLKKNGLKKYFSSLQNIDQADTIKKNNIPVVIKDSFQETEKIIKSDSGSQRILLIGDSMLEGFGLRMNDYCTHNNHEMMRIIWYSSTTQWFASCDTITHFINKFNPTYIILVIGSGDISAKNVLSERLPYVEKILSQIKGHPYIWVGPPNWKEDTGINELLEKTNPEGTFFLSKNLKFDRTSDGVHPTHPSAAKWVDSVATFIVHKSIYPIQLDFPEKKTNKRMNSFLLSPKPPVLN